MKTMLKLKDVYDIPGTPIDLTWGIRSAWIPEVESYGETVDGEASKEIQSEGRLIIRCIIERDFDGDRFADMHTIFFDGEPIMIVRDAGRGGRDFRDRTITNADGFALMCHYIRQKMNAEAPESDLASPDKEVYAEAIFNFYGTDFATGLGFSVEKKTKGFHLYPNAERIIPDSDLNLIMVTALTKLAMPEYMRRGGCVIKRLRALTDEELDRNPLVRSLGAETGHTQQWWFENCERPENTVIVNV